MFVYWFVFGLGIRKGGLMVIGVGEVFFILWMFVGLILWFFISLIILDGLNSVFKRIKMVVKMNFLISFLLFVVIVFNLFSYVIMMVIYIIVLFVSGIYLSFYWF